MQITAVRPKALRWRCTKGHKWEYNPLAVGSNMPNAIEVEGRQVCVRCMLEFVAQHCGTIERDQEEPK